MISIEGKKREIEDLFKSLGLKDAEMMELRDISEKFKISKQTLLSNIKHGSLKAISKSSAKNSTWLVLVTHLKEFFLANCLKQADYFSKGDQA